MAVQSRRNSDLSSFLLDGDLFMTDNAQIPDNDVRSGDMAAYTVMYQVAASSNSWNPYDTATGTDGSEIVKGILVHALTEAQVQAGPVTNVCIYTGGRGARVDENKIVVEGGLNLETESTNQNKTVRAMLNEIGIFPTETEAGDAYENA